ncbi:CHAD domain-containing protein [Sphingomonas lenta]|uniref:CYTH and CHAD domain-containing protein n=1 Tax=Sphingomonas lenta TaxID=1141887 RepID=UPI001FE31B9D|nr:CHAD domain-containing protein [Sphingomonas lenta]
MYERLVTVHGPEGLEVELKLEADADGLDALAAALEARGVRFATRALHARYFDTPEGELRRAGLSLRIRRSGDVRVQTLKAEGAALGALLARPEWERAVEDDTPVLDDAPEAMRGALPNGAVHALAPAFSVEVERRVGAVLDEAGGIEVVIDRGVVRGDRREAPVAEIELELTDGTPAALFALARMLADAAPVRLGMLTKAERGYRLLDRAADKPVKGAQAAIAPDAGTGEAFAAIAGACLRQFRLNEDLLLRAQDPDALHQARVALRRLRSALSIFRRVVADNRFEHLRGELRWLAATLGEARDLDVLLARTGRRDALGEARAAAYARVAEALGSVRARTLMLDLAEWLAVGAWRTAPADAAAVARPARDFAEETLDRLRRRLKKRGKDLRHVDDETRHEVRIDAKKLRYAAEFFAGLFPGDKRKRRARRFIGAMQDLQAHLGDLNDIATAPVVLARLGVAVEPAPAHDRERLIDAAAEAYDALMGRKRFWR